VNFLMTEGSDRIMAAYGKKKYERLVALKNKYDPTNFFSLTRTSNRGKIIMTEEPIQSEGGVRYE